MQVCDHLATYLPTHLPTYLYIHTYIFTHIHTYVHTYILTYVHAYIHKNIHTYVPTYLPTYRAHEGGADGANNGGRRRRRPNGNNDNGDNDGPEVRSASLSIARFLNRLLALDIDNQLLVFNLFEHIFNQVVMEAKAKGKHDSGVVDVYAEKILQVTSHELMNMNGEFDRIALSAFSSI